MEKTSGTKVSRNQSNFVENVLMNDQISLESLQNSLCSQKVINKELLKEIESMRSRFAGTIKMMKDDLFHLIEEKNLLQLKETQHEECEKSLISQMMAEIEQLKKQNQENMADQQATIQEQHRVIQELKAQLNAQKVEKETETQNAPETPDQTQDSDKKDNKVNSDVPSDAKETETQNAPETPDQTQDSDKKDNEVNSDVPSNAKITEETIPRSTRRKTRNIVYRAAHRVSKRVREFASFSGRLH